VKATEELLKKYQIEFGVDVHWIESRLYHPFLSKKTLEEMQKSPK